MNNNITKTANETDLLSNENRQLFSTIENLKTDTHNKYNMQQTLFDGKDNENDINFDQLTNAIKSANNLISDEKCTHQQLINLMSQDYDNKTALNNFNFMNKLAENDKKTFEMNKNLTSQIKTLDNTI